ncbi:MAG TPA: hypothetical protein VIJ25_18835, partial [Methylococcales bacterium]
DSYEPWTMVLPSGKILGVLHPAGHMLAYGMRSVAGIREKDREKVQKMHDNLDELFEDEIHDGMFKEWAQFAGTLAAIRSGQPGSRNKLREGTTNEQILDLVTKSRFMHRMEVKHPKWISFAQGDFIQEKVLRLFIGAA